MTENIYTLASSTNESERLEEQAKHLYGGLEYIVPYVGSAKTVLDVGCGVGTACRFIASRWRDGSVKITGVDNDPGKIQEAKTLSNSVDASTLEFRVGDVYKLPFEDNSYDFVMCRFLLMHVKRPDKVLKEIYRVLKKGGRVLFHEGYHQSASFVPAKTHLQTIIGAWEKCMTDRGQNASIGPELYGLMLRQEYRDVKTDSMSHVAIGTERVYTRYAENWKGHLPTLRKTLEGRVDASVFDNAAQELEQTNPEDLFMESTFIATGVK